MTLNHNYGCFSGVGSGIAGNDPQLNEGGFCKRLVCAAFVLAAVSSLVLKKGFRMACVG